MLTNFDLDFIRSNYTFLGSTECAKQLNRSRTAVIQHAKKMGIVLTHFHRSELMKRKLNKPDDKRNVNPTFFSVPDKMTSVNAYLLGFIWADGHINFNNGKCHVSARFIIDDKDDILPIFNKTGRWSVYNQITKFKESISVQTNNRPLAEFLNSMDYITKSKASAEKILKFIPYNLRYYWWLGCMDGDGCFYIGKSGQEISLHSSYEQDWQHFYDLAKEIGIEFHTEHRITTRGKSSCIRIVKKESCSKFIKYLYPNKYEFGLTRKYKKAESMLMRCENTHIICPHCNKDIYIHKNN